MGILEDAKKNLGYEGKVAQRVARLHPGWGEESSLDDCFKMFKELRATMEVGNEFLGEADCFVCGKHHIYDIFEVSLNGVVVPLGNDCIDNINFIEGTGDFKQVKRDFLYNKTKSLFLAGQLAAKDIRRFRIMQAHRRRRGEAI